MAKKAAKRSGAKPKPVDILKIQGTYRKDRHKFRPEAREGLPEKPEGLCEEASKYWDRLIAYRPEWWDESDAESMTVLVIAWAERKKLEKQLQRDPTDGQVLRAFEKYHKIWFDLVACFGLTPLDRLRMPAAPKKKQAAAKDFLA